MNVVKINSKVDIALQVSSVLSRHNAKIESVKKTVEEIIEKVKSQGDDALRFYAKKFDNVTLESLRVSDEEIETALMRADYDFIETLKRAKANIESFHSLQKYSPVLIDDDGAYLTQKITPLKRVGIYVPNGRYPYPSTVLMNAIPAMVAGVEEVVMISPAGKDGNISDNILVAASICGVKEIYKTGGAHGIAALAYGTSSIKKVDKICGPGNVFVTLAKKSVYGDVDIDMLAGPSEVLVIADENSNSRYVAADMLSQAEHDEKAAAMLVTTSETFAKDVALEIVSQLKALPEYSRKTAAKSISDYIQIFIAENMEDAFKVSNEVAPEHLEIALKNARDYIDLVKNAGTVFLGEYTPEPVGDYYAGTNHTIPTSGKAKFYSPLCTYDFVKRTSIVEYSKDKFLRSADDVMLMATKEGLFAHKNSVNVRIEEEAKIE